MGIVLTIAMIFDIREYRVPNRCIWIGFMIGLLYQISVHGMAGAIYWLAGAGGIGLLFAPLFLLRLFGAADIKLFMIIGGCFGVSFTLSHGIVALLIGAVCSIGKTLLHHNLLDRLRILASYLYIVIAGRTLLKYVREEEKTSASSIIPFAFPIWVAYGIMLFCKPSFL